MEPQCSVGPLMMHGASPTPTAPRMAPGQIWQVNTVEGHKFGLPPPAACKRQYEKLARAGVGGRRLSTAAERPIRFGPIRTRKQHRARLVREARAFSSSLGHTPAAPVHPGSQDRYALGNRHCHCGVILQLPPKHQKEALCLCSTSGPSPAASGAPASGGHRLPWPDHS
ncbi:hypothetical protein NDU88_003769 [Pleurodeles waltl]|uniref:Uncharacterized protein n=1 Tax=Pleurodeles waltl TaxID=8319 RepID=A0AAV7VIC1_PLEWA|nr:hypothetical protein NDU88_003769 [Pleurodeles waltl]